MPDRPLPTGAPAARPGRRDLRLILARAWAPDHHLVRDIALATTTEL